LVVGFVLLVGADLMGGSVCCLVGPGCLLGA
jgi:hypothetical protein